MMGKYLIGRQNTEILESRKQQRTDRKHSFLLESELINRDHRTISKQQLELHQNEKKKTNKTVNVGFQSETLMQYD